MRLSVTVQVELPAVYRDVRPITIEMILVTVTINC